jgi:subtilisin family serine protease
MSLQVLAIALGFVIYGLAPTVSARADLSPLLESKLQSPDTSDRQIAVVVFLDNNQSGSAVRAASRPGMNRAERIKFTSRALESSREAGDAAVSRFLAQHSSTIVKRLWIVPAYSATISLSSIEPLRSIAGVKLVVPDLPLELVTPVSVEPAPALSTGVASALTQMNVPTLWRRGLTGKGRLVCSFDTGVQESHPALVSKWRGLVSDLHAAWFSTLKPDTLPYDNAGHGTHTMGIMVGSTSGDTIGVAPDAQWITAGVIDQGKALNLTVVDILQAFQWALNPDGDPSTTDDVPDVILNSWGIPKGIFPACDATFSAAIDNVEAAGIVTVFAAGNEGPTPMSMRQPADRASSPTNAFSVGAVDGTLAIAAFSSRGPSSCDSTQIKPEIVAPGVAIRSSTKGSTYVNMSGTSMAAPFIAGLVALMRQYNPNATVTEIKEAIMKSAIDLGDAGEDNTYGHGFVDASHVIEHLPEPDRPIFVVPYKGFLGSGVAMPGQSSNLQVTLTNSTGTVDAVIGSLVPLVSGAATVTSAVTTFTFGVGGTTAVSQPNFALVFGDTLPHGTVVPFRLYLSSPTDGQLIDSIGLQLVCGIVPPGQVVAHDANNLKVAVSDFGEFGLATGSIYNLGAAGFTYRNGVNLLYEGGVVLARNDLQVSSAVRDSSGQTPSSDFKPVSSLTSTTDARSGIHWSGRFVDTHSPIPIPITVSQETSNPGTFLNSDILLVKYQLINSSADKLTGLYLGFLADFDLGSADTIGFDAGLNLIWQTTAGGPFVGVVGLENFGSFKTLDNVGGKTGFTRSELYGAVSETGVHVSAVGTSADRMFMVSTSAIELFSGDSAEAVFAFVAGDNLADLLAKASEAHTIFDSPTDVDDTQDGLPTDFVLHQNYPNPFNPTTNISFSLSAPSHTALRVYNVLGQEVRTIVNGLLSAGNHTLTWDGRDNGGSEAASGVYLYQLQAGSKVQSRKMMLVR